MKFLKKLIQSYQELEDAQVISKNLEQELHIVLTKLAPFRRIAYLPITATPTAPRFSEVSKFGGAPYLRNTQDWPVCPNCDRHLQFLMQLDLTSLPERPQNGLAQLFYCTSKIPDCASEHEAFFPFSKTVVSRIIEVDGPSEKILPRLNELFAERTITDWTAKYDYPHFREYNDLGINLNIDSIVVDLMKERQVGLPIREDKLFGYPYWMQGVEYPKDRKTRSPMRLLFQLLSKQNSPIMFGDNGIGYCMQSPDDRHELTLSWSCY